MDYRESEEELTAPDDVLEAAPLVLEDPQLLVQLLQLDPQVCERQAVFSLHL